MGIDITAYRMRIGCFNPKFSGGIEIVDIKLDFNKIAKCPVLLFVASMLLVVLILNTRHPHKESSPMPHGILQTSIFLGGMINHLSISFKQKTRGQRVIGAVAFIGLLLLLAGIEPNPGPGSQDGDPNKNGQYDLVENKNLQNTSDIENTSTEIIYQRTSDVASRISLNLSSNSQQSDDNSASLSPVDIPEDSSLQTRVQTIYNIGDSPQGDTEVTSDFVLSSRGNEKVTSGRQLNIECETILTKLGLRHFFPEKLTFNDVMAIRQKRDGTMSMSDIPIEMIRRIIMLDYTALDSVMEEYSGNKSSLEEENSDDESSSDNDDDDDDDDDVKVDSDKLSALDIFIVVFNCCDHFLKQILVNKMFMCRLAVPFIYKPMTSTELKLSIWPLRSIILDIEHENMTAVSLVKCPLKVVTFLRLGRPSLSKSDLINKIISKHKDHATFYHKDCLSGSVKRTFSNGIAEVSWYIPSGTKHESKEDSIFNDVLMFINLRGNASDCEEQIRCLLKISNILIVVINFSEIDQSISMIKSWTMTSEVSLILIPAGGRISKTKEDDIHSEVPTLKILQTFKKSKMKNASKLKQNLCENISKLLKPEKITKITIEDCMTTAKGVGVGADEDSGLCKSTKELSEKCFSQIPKNEKDALFSKRSFFPLQGNLWQDLSKHYKRCKKTGKNSLNENDMEVQNIKIHHQERADLCRNISSFFGTFIDILISNMNDRNFMLYFLNWLKFFIDDHLHSSIPLLSYESDSYWKAYKKAKKADKSSLKEKINKIASEKENASLGLEHIFRELFQVYEAMEAIPNAETSDSLKNYKHLPDVFSNLLLYGFPLELMDGDASNIPITWLRALLESLKNKIGDKKLIVLSILGVQSSGKSTLLNTMFGIQFAVSAGRCTRGIYMHLLPIKTAKESKTKSRRAEYVLLLDTEGIKAQENEQNIDHDNELVTLALGIGNIAIINIKGEHDQNISEVLQIAVHAFLRLKLANEKLNIRQPCLFAHQNVSAGNADQKLKESRQRLVQVLDQTTLGAAKQENFSDIFAFNQIIDFDIDKNVFYFPDLWEGIPPMAHVNHGYSKKALIVKQKLLSEDSMQKCKCLKISETITYILDLWNGILADDFVFSFRNSLEIKLYNAMVTKYQQICWNFEKHVSEIFEKTKDSFEGNESQQQLQKKT